MAGENLLENDTIVSCLQHAVTLGESGLSNVPGLLKRVINEKMWQRRVVEKTGEEVNFTRFEEFLAAHLPEGMHTDVRTLRNLCRDDREALDLLDRVTQNPASLHTAFDNIQGSNTEPAPTGTSSAAALRRLRKDRPDLHTRVLSGELSPHAAAVEAGFRKKTITVPVDPQKAADALRRHFTEEELAEIARILAPPRYICPPREWDEKTLEAWNQPQREIDLEEWYRDP